MTNKQLLLLWHSGWMLKRPQLECSSILMHVLYSSGHYASIPAFWVWNKSCFLQTSLKRSHATVEWHQILNCSCIISVLPMLDWSPTIHQRRCEWSGFELLKMKLWGEPIRAAVFHPQIKELSSIQVAQHMTYIQEQWASCMNIFLYLLLHKAIRGK